MLRALPDQQRWSARHALGVVAPWEPGARLRPPKCPSGMEIGPPDFVGVGAQKAGTTWWYQLLTTHPEVYDHPAAHKERHYFDRFIDADFTRADEADYHRWFPRPPGQITGEWTPDYMLHFWIPPLLRRAAPDTKLLVLLRDPVERIVSGLTHVARRQAYPDARAATEAYLRGCYADQLDALVQHCGGDRVLVQQFEQCCADPAGQLKETCAFLGIPEPPAPLDAQPVNTTVGAKVQLPESARLELVRLYRPTVERLLTSYPQIDVSLWPNFAFVER